MELQRRKVLFINRADPFLEEKLTELGIECQHEYEADREQLKKIIGTYWGLVIRSRITLDADFLAHAADLAFIARLGVGVEHIDLDYATKKGIQVLTSPEGSSNTVGEHTIGLLLMLMNNLSRADREVRAGQWLREPNRGTEIKGKTIGILGYGNMGQAFARKLPGFEARVIAYDKFKTNYGDQFAKEVDLETLQVESDILSIHIPFIPSNHHFINGDFLKGFQKSIYLINTARGLVLNTADLVEQLERGKVLGAALDVNEYEESSFAVLNPDELPAPFQYLRKAENVILNPHIAGWSVEAVGAHARVLARKIEALINRKTAKF